MQTSCYAKALHNPVKLLRPSKTCSTSSSRTKTLGGGRLARFQSVKPLWEARVNSQMPDRKDESGCRTRGFATAVSTKEDSGYVIPLSLLSYALSCPAALAQDAPSGGGYLGFTGSPIEILLLLSPILSYGIFSIYRDQVNPRAKWSDFVFLIAAFIVIGNILSIIFLKIRLF